MTNPPVAAADEPPERPERGRSLHFCFVTTFYPPFHFGGDAIFVHRLAHALADRGHRIDVVHSIDAWRIGGGREPSEGFWEHPDVR